jgi:hypothetical protein
MKGNGVMLRPAASCKSNAKMFNYNLSFQNDFAYLVRHFPDELARVNPVPAIQCSIRFPISEIQEPRKSRFIQAIETFFIRHGAMLMNRNAKDLYISFGTMKSKEEKICILKFQNSLFCWQQKKPMTDKAFTHGAVAGLFCNIIPNEMSAHIASFLSRKDGGRLACVSSNANKSANQETVRIDTLLNSVNPDLSSVVETEIKMHEQTAMEKFKEFLNADPMPLERFAQFLKPEHEIRKADMLGRIDEIAARMRL